MNGRVQSQAGYASVAVQLARQALAVAFDTAPHRPPQGERRWPMAEALPAARLLVGQGDQADRQAISTAADALRETLTDPTGKVTDGFGHTRPVYRWLALHLLGSAAKLTEQGEAVSQVTRAVEAALARGLEANDDDPRLGVWRLLVAREHGLDAAQPDWADVEQDREVPTPLVTLGRDDLIDAWTYRELVGLHGLYMLADLTNDTGHKARAASAARYHLGHTQPDYTTYQPWGLAAFASDVETAVFAEQQLHDVATHLSIEGPGGAVLPALLLADAAAMMGGRADAVGPVG